MKALVVGASGGLGSAFVAQLVEDCRFTHVEAWARTPLSISHGKLSTTRVDLGEEATIETAARGVREFLGELDLIMVATGLLHNDHVRPEKTWRALDPAMMRQVFEINTIGPALVAKHVLPLLPRDRRSVFAALSARVGSISDNRLGGWHSYRASKAALNQLIRCFAIELAPRRPQAICVGLHPGTVDTGLSKPFQNNVPGDQLFTPAQSARHLLDVVDSLTPGQSGRVFDWSGVEIAP